MENGAVSRLVVPPAVQTQHQPLHLQLRSVARPQAKLLPQVGQFTADRVAAGSHSLSRQPLQVALQEAVSLPWDLLHCAQGCGLLKSSALLRMTLS